MEFNLSKARLFPRIHLKIPILSSPTKMCLKSHSSPLSRSNSCTNSRFQPLDLFFGRLILKAYSDSGLIGGSRNLFDWMPERNLIAWSSMILAYAQSNWSVGALAVFLDCHRLSFDHPNEVVLATVLKGGKELTAINRAFCLLFSKIATHTQKLFFTFKLIKISCWFVEREREDWSTRN